MQDEINEKTVIHAVKQCIKLPPLRGFFRFLFRKKELVYGYIIAEHKLKEYLYAGVLPHTHQL